MASYEKALIESDGFDPVKNLWRNVLIVAIEDAIKVTHLIKRFPDHYGKRRYHAIDYVTLPNGDFKYVCEYAKLDHNIVRKKIIQTLERIKDDKKDMPKMFRKWLHQDYKGGGMAQQIKRNSSTMSNVQQ